MTGVGVILIYLDVNLTITIYPNVSKQVLLHVHWDKWAEKMAIEFSKK